MTATAELKAPQHELYLVSDGQAKEILGKAAHLRLDLVGGLPEIGAHLGLAEGWVALKKDEDVKISENQMRQQLAQSLNTVVTGVTGHDESLLLGAHPQHREPRSAPAAGTLGALADWWDRRWRMPD